MTLVQKDLWEIRDKRTQPPSFRLNTFFILGDPVLSGDAERNNCIVF